MRTSRALCAVLLASTVLSCSYTPPTPGSQQLNDYPFRASGSGIGVGVNAYVSEERLKERLPAASTCLENGVLPIQVLILNDRQNEILVRTASIALVFADGSRRSALTVPETFEAIKGSVVGGALAFGIIGAVAVSSQNENRMKDLMAVTLRDGSIGPGTGQTGFLFFALKKGDSSLNGAKLVMALQLAAAPTQIAVEIGLAGDLPSERRSADAPVTAPDASTPIDPHRAQGDWKPMFSTGQPQPSPQPRSAAAAVPSASVPHPSVSMQQSSATVTPLHVEEARRAAANAEAAGAKTTAASTGLLGTKGAETVIRGSSGAAQGTSSRQVPTAPVSPSEAAATTATLSPAAGAPLPTVAKTNSSRTPWLGVPVGGVSAQAAKAAGLTQSGAAMVLPFTRNPNLPVVDLDPGDVLLAVDGTVLEGPGHLSALLATKPAGSTVRVRVYRAQFNKQLEQPMVIFSGD